MNNSVVFLIRNLGDYHAPRLLDAQTFHQRSGIRFDTVVFSRESEFYKHKQTRSGKIEQNLNLIDLRDHGWIKKTFALNRYFKENRPSLVCQIGYHGKLPFVGLIFAKVYGAKIVFCTDSKSDDGVRRTTSEKIKGVILRLYDGALVAGKQHKEYLRELGFPESSISTGYDVVDNSYFENRSLSYKRLSKRIEPDTAEKKFILVVSRLVKRKRVSEALKIFEASEARKEGYCLLVVGDGPEKIPLREEAKILGIENSVFWIDSIENTRMPLLYTRAQLTLLCSEYDQWGLCVNESMACGTPVIASSRCGCAGNILIHGSNGFVYSANSVDRVLEAAHYCDEILLNSNLRHSFAKQCSLTIKEWGLRRFSEGIYGFVKNGI